MSVAARDARGAWLALALVVLPLLAPRQAAADWRGHLAAGPALAVTGDGGEPLRLAAAAELWGPRRLGAGLALHVLGGRERLGLATLRLSVQAAASPPRLFLRLHGELGAALATPAPALGAGLAVTLRLWGALGVVAQAHSHLVIDGVDETRLVTSLAVLGAIVW